MLDARPVVCKLISARPPDGRLEAAPRAVHRALRDPVGQAPCPSGDGPHADRRRRRGASRTADGVAFRVAPRRRRRHRPGGHRAPGCSATGRLRGALPRRRLRAAAAATPSPLLLRHRGRYTLLTETGVGRRRGRLTGASCAAARLRERAPVRTPWRVVVTGGARRRGRDRPAAGARPPSRIARHELDRARPRRLVVAERPREPQSLETQKAVTSTSRPRMGWEYVTVDEGWDPAWIAGARRLRARARRQGDPVVRPGRRRRRGARPRRGAGARPASRPTSSLRQRAEHRGDGRHRARRRRAAASSSPSTAAPSPRGLQRTWPNVLTVEAVRGAEYAADRRCATTSTSPSRAIPSAAWTSRRTARGARLAQAIVFESGLQHYAVAGARCWTPRSPAAGTTPACSRARPTATP